MIVRLGGVEPAVCRLTLTNLYLFMKFNNSLPDCTYGTCIGVDKSTDAVKVSACPSSAGIPLCPVDLLKT